MGMIDDAIQSLELAARSSRQRFEAASTLGRLLAERDDRAARSRGSSGPPKRPRRRSTPAAPCSTIWPTCSKTSASTARALAVFGELDADAGGYRDVPARHRAPEPRAGPGVGAGCGAC